MSLFNSYIKFLNYNIFTEHRMIKYAHLLTSNKAISASSQSAIERLIEYTLVHHYNQP